MKEDWDESRGGEGLFEDLHFPADDTSLFSDFSTPIASLQGDIAWRRPQEICRSPVLLPDNMHQAHAKQGLLGDCWFLCACTVLLKNQHLLDRVLPPDQPHWGASGYQGRFRFRLWQQGRWAEVTVDDRLPCVGAALCFSRCHAPNAFWVALLEKAYAKLHGSYERLWAGQVSEALVDLTGGLAECLSLGSAERRSLGSAERQSLGSAECLSLGSAERRSLGSAECLSLGSAECLSLGSAERRSLGSAEPSEELEEERGTSQDSDRGRRRRLNLNQLHAVRDGCSLSCSTHSTPAGGSGEPGQHHAMSVMEWVDVRRTSGGTVRLLRTRNPWGRRSCAGAWTERGEGWSSVDPVCALGLQGRAEEGDFWLDEAEFVSQFDDVTVGYPINREGHLQSIYTGNVLRHSTQAVGRWVKGQSAGGCRNSSGYATNPKLWLKVCQSGEVLISLLQHRRRRAMGTHYTQRPPEGASNAKHQHYLQAIALHMWKVEKKKRLNLGRTLSSTPCASTHCHAYEREVVLHGHLEPGYHLLVPSTFLPGAEASFLVRAFSLCPVSLSVLKAPGPSLPLATDGGEWETSVFRGAWEVGTTGGGSRNFLSHCRNPRFPFAVREDPAKTAVGANNVRVGLRQNRADTDLHPIGFHIYKVPEEEGVPEPTLPRDEEPVASCVPHCYMQDVSLSCRLPVGLYAVVPSTYQPDCPASFTLTVAHTIHRRVVKSQERLGRSIQEVSHISLMRS